MTQKYPPDIEKHVLLMSSVFGSNYSCEQVFSLMKRVKGRAFDEHSEGCMQIAATETEPQATVVSNI
jgi:hypothetical protein